MKFADWILKVEGKPPRPPKRHKSLEWPTSIYNQETLEALIDDVLGEGVGGFFGIDNLDNAFKWASHSSECVFNEAYETEVVSQELYDICSSWSENLSSMPTDAASEEYPW